MQEKWIPVKGYEKYYAVSNLGNMKSLERIMYNNFGKCIRKEKIKKLKPCQNGYIKTTLTKENEDNKHVLIHRLVAQAFIPNPNNLPMVNHINGIKHDNRVENLEWCDDSHNSRHAIEIGLTYVRKGEEIYFSKFTNYQVWLIKNIYHNNEMTITDISKMVGVNRRTISDMVKNRTWKHITLNSYNLEEI